MSDIGCTVCYSREHSARECRRVVCNFCSRIGHMKRDCSEYRRVRTVRVHFVHTAIVRAAVTSVSHRDQPELFQFLRTLPELGRTINGQHVFSSDGNQLLIEYHGQSDIQISLQNGVQNHETLIQIASNRVKITPKYSILAHELYEDNDRDAMGTHLQTAPMVPANVLLVCESLFRSTSAALCL